MALHIVTVDQVARLCDRNDAIAQSLVYADVKRGFSLQITVGAESYSVVERDGSPLYFRSVDQLLDVLLDVPNVSHIASIDMRSWAGVGASSY
ncbi:hypothetical protein GNZ25_14165 [Burkholderia thailandensis]|uniref:hypothetical protein n=1 Tax=Burkholderia thailandensis TaxID=57975 RepID=UPI0012E9456B|nr:hypothetical protein [Burkholderia thailandensis]MUV22482.1 hypothetical protein [Burkholderia thailandensis]